MRRTRSRDRDQDPTCNTNRNSTHWMLNDGNVDPCKLVELTMQTCDSEATQSAPGIVQGDLKCPGDPSSDCCCSITTYSLLSACWVCQGHHSKDIETGIRPTYTQFFQECFGVTNISNAPPETQNLHLPLWATLRPASLDTKWNFEDARVNASGLSPPTLSPAISGSSVPTITESSVGINSVPPTAISTSRRASTPPGTIAAAVLGSCAAVALMFVGGWAFWRWQRRRRVIRAQQGTRVDLTEPEMHQTPPQHAPQHTSTFPFPYEGVVPRYHPDARHSYNPSRSDEPDAEAEPASFRRPGGQLRRDISRLTGAAQQHLSSRGRSTHSHGDHSGSGSSSTATNSRRPRRKSGADGTSQGRYFHLPPSAQYLADVARYPENVDPERPWNIRR